MVSPAQHKQGSFSTLPALNRNADGNRLIMPTRGGTAATPQRSASQRTKRNLTIIFVAVILCLIYLPAYLFELVSIKQAHGPQRSIVSLAMARPGPGVPWIAIRHCRVTLAMYMTLLCCLNTLDK
jgi:hypothetical protein